MIFKLLRNIKPVNNNGLGVIRPKPLKKIHLFGKQVDKFLKERKLKNGKL
jgi:hypothetical protein